MKNRLGVSFLSVTWRIPVEDQDHNHPPKRIVEKIFEEHGKRYQGIVDAGNILRMSNYKDIATRCSQCFKPFVEFLESLKPCL